MMFRYDAYEQVAYNITEKAQFEVAYKHCHGER